MRKTDRDRMRIDVLSTAEGHLKTRTEKEGERQRQKEKDRDRTDVLSMQRVISGRPNSVTSKCMQESAYLIMSHDS